MTFLKGGVDGLGYFSLIFSYFIFYPESSLIYINKVENKYMGIRIDP